MDSALIIFSRLPIGRETKTRLAGLLTEAERERLNIAIWQDVFNAVSGLRDMINLDVYYIDPAAAAYNIMLNLSREQCSGSLGIRMSQAMHEIFKYKYRRVCLIKTHLKYLRAMTQ